MENNGNVDFLALTVADFDKDGDLDIAGLQDGQASAPGRIYLGRGDGTFFSERAIELDVKNQEDMVHDGAANLLGMDGAVISRRLKDVTMRPPFTIPLWTRTAD